MGVDEPKSKHKAQAEEKHGYEFLGPPGAAVIVFGLPLLVYVFIFTCNDVSGCPAPALLNPRTLTLEKLKSQTSWPEDGIAGLFDMKVMLCVLGWYAWSLALQLFMPGVELDGSVLGTGGRHHYKFNAFNSALLTLAGLGAGTLVQGADFPVWDFIWDNYPQIVTANILIAWAFSIWVYLGSFSVPHSGKPNLEHRELAKGGHSGNILYDFFIGRELNPRVTVPSWIPIAGGQIFDIKVFNEIRPGMTGWLVLNLAFVVHQYKAHGFVTDSIIMVTAFQSLYILDAMYMEPAILTTIDIITDGFGFMLSFGDLVWVPHVYSMQARYLAVYPLQLGVWGILGVLLVVGSGYYIFRGANNEKNRFRTNPSDPANAHLQTLQTESGSKLITSGWWGLARHINYFGDWTMSWAYCLPTGIAGYVIHNYTNPVTGNVTREVVQGDARGWGTIYTYFYMLYFAILLIHRQRRDDEKCKRKYGKDWDKYVKIVPSRIVPGIY